MKIKITAKYLRTDYIAFFKLRPRKGGMTKIDKLILKGKIKLARA